MFIYREERYAPLAISSLSHAINYVIASQAHRLKSLIYLLIEKMRRLKKGIVKHLQRKMAKVPRFLHSFKNDNVGDDQHFPSLFAQAANAFGTLILNEGSSPLFILPLVDINLYLKFY